MKFIKQKGNYIKKILEHQEGRTKERVEIWIYKWIIAFLISFLNQVNDI